MKCFACKGGTTEKSTTTYMTSVNDCYIIIKNVPCEKCTQCGETFFNGVTAQKIEEIVERVKSALTEIAVIDYSKAA